MTLQQLNDHYALVEQYLNAEFMLRRMQDAAGLKAQVMTGMPHGTGVSDKVGDTAVEIVRASEAVDQLYRRLKKDEAPILEWIDTVDDICTQTALRLRFVHGKPWKEISDLVGFSEKAVKSRCHRELEEPNQQLQQAYSAR